MSARLPAHPRSTYGSHAEACTYAARPKGQRTRDDLDRECPKCRAIRLDLHILAAPPRSLGGK